MALGNSAHILQFTSIHCPHCGTLGYAVHQSVNLATRLCGPIYTSNRLSCLNLYGSNHLFLLEVLPSDMRDRLRELEYGLSLRDALFPAPEIPGHLQYLAPDAWAKVTEVKAALTEVEILIGAAAHCIYSVTGPSRPSTFSDRDFAIEMASFARFYSSFKKWTSDVERRVRNLAKASSCKVAASVHRRNGAAGDNAARRQRSGESASRFSRNGHDKQGSDRKRHNSRHLNTVGIMDNILAGLDSEPLYADIHRVQVKGQQNVPSTVTNVTAAAATSSSPASS